MRILPRCGAVLVAAGLSITFTMSAWASTVQDEWAMQVVNGSSPNLAGGSAMTFTGSWKEVVGKVGSAVKFTDAPSFGVAPGTADDNPDGGEFAVSEVFTSAPIPADPHYSGNLVQKGSYDDPGQVKMQLVPANEGSVSCRIKGSNGAQMLHSWIRVDDGAWHTATCWRDGSQVGLTVDQATVALWWNPGIVANGRAWRTGNKSASADWTDQHFGAVDCVAVALGSGARDRALASVPC